jgi:hypothetical protein
VDEHVAFQLIRAAERAPAVWAWEWSFSRMRPNMLCKVTSLDKALAAVRADKRFVAIMRALVDREARRDSKRFAASRVVAHIRFIVRVSAEMRSKRRSLAETLPADMTRERPVTRVAL